MSTGRTIYLVPARNVTRTVVNHPPQPRRVYAMPPKAAVPVMQQQMQPKPSIQQTQQRPVTSNPLKRSAPPAVALNPLIEELLGESNANPTPRKREKLTHLSPEEKLNRRKLKNRVAAQTARDRKKLRSQQLVDAIHQLVDENAKLREDNQLLREKMNQRDLSLESAAFISGPLLREQAKSRLVLLLTCLSTLFPKTSSVACSKISKKIAISTSSRPSFLLKSKKTSLASKRRPSFCRKPAPRRLWSRIS